MKRNNKIKIERTHGFKRANFGFKRFGFKD
jgi:hypothetical protein